ncbi:hypothetical protein D2E70_08475 [Mycobacteroides abscessus]|nr:hypothetical protein D2E70_08475 [Mycobacteroides abscessus]
MGRYGDLRRFDEFCDGDTDIAAFVIAAAREMAKSVQELHRPGPLSGFSTSWMTGAKAECTTCRRGWPCETAKRVYPSEELGL